MALSHKTDYGSEGIARLLEQYRDKPRILGLLKSYLDEVQAAEDAVWAVYSARNLQTVIAAFPILITITTAGFNGTMKFTYSLAGGAASSAIASGVGAFSWNLPATPLFFLFSSAVNFTVGWTYSISAAGVFTYAGGSGANQVSLQTSDLLAKLGKIVGQSSYGFNDALYVLLITARIRTNNSAGVRRDLLDITNLLTPPLATAQPVGHDYQPATFQIEAKTPTVLSPYIIVSEFLGKAKAAGVRLDYIYNYAASSSTIITGSVNEVGFAAGPPTTEPDVLSGQCMGTVNNAGFTAGPPVTSDAGGVLAGIVTVDGGSAP